MGAATQQQILQQAQHRHDGVIDAHLLQVQPLRHPAQDGLRIRARLACLVRLPEGLQGQLHGNTGTDVSFPHNTAMLS